MMKSKKQKDVITVLIIDDERKACDHLEAVLNKYAPVNIFIAGKSTDIRQADKLIEQTDPDLVFLDINMPYETGVEFLSRIGPYSFEVIFVTAYDEYALKAFKLNAIDYILKPVSIPEIIVALEKTWERLMHKEMLLKDPEFYSRILKQVYSKASLTQFTFRDKNTIHVVPFEDLIYIEGMASYSRLYYIQDGRERSFVLSRSLAEYEQLLPQEMFYRVHKSYLVNRAHVVNVLRDGQPAALLRNKEVLPVGRRRLSRFLSFLSGTPCL